MSKEKVVGLYVDWIQAWNDQNASAMQGLLSEKVNMVGFDGSQMNGRDEIITVMKSIFEHNPTARFVTIVQEVRFPAPGMAVLRAVAGMVPRGAEDINPIVNAIQMLIAAEVNGEWRIEVFQNTPAAFHGRPELVEALSNDLRAALHRTPLQ